MWGRSNRLTAALIWLCAVASILLLVALPVRASVGAAETQGKEFCSRPHLEVGESPPRFKVRLGLSRSEAARGKRLKLRIENYGSESVAYGYAYRLRRKSGSSWREVPVGPFYGARLFTQSASAGRCQEIRIGRKWVPGRYRIEKDVWLAEESSDSSRSPAVSFKVTG